MHARRNSDLGMSSRTSAGSTIIPPPDDSVLKAALRKAEIELNETPESRRKALKELKILLEESPKTRGIDFEEDFVFYYLRVHKYSVKKTFNQLQNYVDLKRKYPGLFEALPDEYFTTGKKLVKAAIVIPTRCPDGCIVVVIRVGILDDNEISIEDAKRGFLMVFLQLYRDPMSQIHGFKVIYDFKGTNVRHLKYASFHNLWLFQHVAMHCLPARWKGIHVINPTFLLKPIWTIIKPFLSEKLRSRVYFHSSPEELLNYFPRSILFSEYGGELSDVDCVELIRNLNREYRNNSIRGQPNFYSDSSEI